MHGVGNMIAALKAHFVIRVSDKQAVCLYKKSSVLCPPLLVSFEQAHFSDNDMSYCQVTS